MIDFVKKKTKVYNRKKRNLMFFIFLRHIFIAYAPKGFKT